MRQKKGFTLIELLVVIAIIGILSAIGLVALNGAREKARDAQRKSDLAQINTAMALYYDDNSSLYPGVGTVNTGEIYTTSLDGGGNSDIFPAYLARTFTIPGNSSSTGACALVVNYYYTADGIVANRASNFALFTRLEAPACDQLYVINNSGIAQTFDDNTDITVATAGRCGGALAAGQVGLCGAALTNN